MHAFTLIELLVVVAIIAILAAIAVPNFLEAQIRSKVTKVRGDFRTISMALEAYAVDANTYPFPTDSVVNTLTQNIVYHYSLPISLSTPIPYLSKLLYDEFRWRVIPDHPFILPDVYLRYMYMKPPFRFVPSTINIDDEYLLSYGNWYIRSWGPDRVCNNKRHWGRYHDSCRLHGLWSIFTPYDPTNGTISWGNIFRTQIDPHFFKVDLINP